MAILLSGGMAWALNQSLVRPLDWFGRWSADSQRTDDRALGFATLSGGARFGNGKIGTGLDMLEATCQVDLEDWIALNGMTIEFWLKPHSITPARTLIGLLDTRETPPLGFVLEKGEICITFGGTGPGTQLLHSGFFLTTNEWTHVAVSADGRELRLYINGEQAAARNDPENASCAAYSLTFGRGAPSPPDNGYFGDTKNFQGLIDEVALYPRALNHKEVRQLWRATAWRPVWRRAAIQILKAICFGLLLGGVALALLVQTDRFEAPRAELKPLTIPRRYGMALTVLVMGSSLSAAAWLRLHDQLDDIGRERLLEVIHRFCEQFDNRTEMYTQRFQNVRDWLESRSDTTPGEWWRHIIAASLFEECPGLKNVGYAQRVDRDQIPAHEESWRTYFQNYSIHPQAPASERAPLLAFTAKEAQPAFPLVLYVDENYVRPVLTPGDYGLDLTTVGMDSTKPSGETSMMAYAINSRLPGAAVGGNWAARTGMGASTRNCARLYFSVVAPTNTAARLSSNVRGLFFASIDWYDFFKHAFGYGSTRLSFRLSMSDGAREVLLAELNEPRTTQGAVLTQRRSVRFYRNRIYFDFAASRSILLQDQLAWPGLIGGVGLAVTILTTGLLTVQIRARWKQETVSSQLRLSQAELRAALKDRERISRDLHDGTIQSIYAITLGLGRCRKLIGNKPELLTVQIEQCVGDLRGVIDGIRQFLLTLEPEVLKGLNFLAALEELVAHMARTTDIPLIFEPVSDAAANVPPREAIQLLNIAREGISNSVRHSGATRISVAVSGRGGSVQLTITDNGRGFDVACGSQGRGLDNMEERTREIGATFHLETTLGRGVKLSVVFPLPHPQHDT